MKLLRKYLRKYGVAEEYIFEEEDLTEFKNIPKVTRCFAMLAKMVSQYRVAHLLWERNMLTQNLKLRLGVSLFSDPGHPRNLEFDVNIFLSQSRWATLYACSAQANNIY